MQLNTSNVHQRDLVLFNEPYDMKKYGARGNLTREFKGLTYAGCLELYELNVLDPEEQQNEAPPVREIVEFLRCHPNFTAHGYAVGPARDDYRVSLEGVECGADYDLSDIQDFFSLFKYPDELQVDATGVYCWYD